MTAMQAFFLGMTVAWASTFIAVAWLVFTNGDDRQSSQPRENGF
jgi:hypothetical protein